MGRNVGVVVKRHRRRRGPAHNPWAVALQREGPTFAHAAGKKDVRAGRGREWVLPGRQGAVISGTSGKVRVQVEEGTQSFRHGEERLRSHVVVFHHPALAHAPLCLDNPCFQEGIEVTLECLPADGPAGTASNDAPVAMYIEVAHGTRGSQGQQKAEADRAGKCTERLGQLVGVQAQVTRRQRRA